MKLAMSESLKDRGLVKEEQTDSGGEGGGLVKEEPREQLNGFLQRMEQRAVAKSNAQIDARDAVEASGWPEGSAEFDAREDIAMQEEMQLAMEQAALDVRRRHLMRRRRHLVKQEPTEQQPAVPIVKEEQPAPPFIDLTRTPTQLHRRRGAEALLNAPLTEAEKDLNDL